MSAIELRVLDLAEVRSAIAAGIREGLRAAAAAAGGWLNLQGVAAAYGISVEALYKRPQLLPCRCGPESGAPDAPHVYRADEVQALVYMPEPERMRRYRERLRMEA